MKIKRIKQAGNGYEGGGYIDVQEELVPESALGYVGTGMVDASELGAKAGNISDIIGAVNAFDSSLLTDIAYIFDFGKSGAYGVYLTELTRAIKNKLIRKDLENMGYEVEITQDQITATDPDGQRDEAQIQSDIQSAQDKQAHRGGMAIGLGMASVLRDVNEDVQTANSNMLSFLAPLGVLDDPTRSNQIESVLSSMADKLLTIKVASTIVHEAIHARGDVGNGNIEGESPAEAAAESFMERMVPQVNSQILGNLRQILTDEEWQQFEQIKGDYEPIQFSGEKRHASGDRMIKEAQLAGLPAMPPQGSDLTGRFPGELFSREYPGWGLLAQQDQTVAIESKLGRQFMAPLPEGLSQENDSLDLQLSKYREQDNRIGPHDTMEELLALGYEEGRGYIPMETLLNETRPTPLMTPIPKSAEKKSWYKRAKNKLKKVATLFGWYNNLEISDGSTIPGLSDRVMLWEDSEDGPDDDPFAWSGQKIRAQFRYNPTYSNKGIYYVLDNIRGWPYSATKGADQYSNLSPFGRMAAKSLESDDISRVVQVLSLVRSRILKNRLKATRLIMTGDVFPIVDEILDSPHIRIVVVPLDGVDEDGSQLFAMWVTDQSVSDKEISIAERLINTDNKLTEEEGEFIEDLLGTSSRRKESIEKIIKETSKICKEFGIKDVYLVGGYVRALAMKGSFADIEDLDFSGSWPNESIKVGGLLAERLGVAKTKIYERTLTLSFVYNGIKVDFKGNFNPVEIREKLRIHDIPTTPLNMDVYNRDFTVNMLVYNLYSKKVLDITGESLRDIKRGVLRTFFEAEFICEQNPLIIFRALKFKLRYGFRIDKELSTAMQNNAHLLFDGRYSEDRLAVARDMVRQENRVEADKLFKEYGLEEGLNSFCDRR